MFRNNPEIRRNRRARTGDYIALGVTNGGRRILEMSTGDELDTVTDEQAADHYYRHREEIERDPGEPVGIEFTRPLSLVVSVRLRADEAEKVAAAAEAAGMKVSTFIRQAAVVAATHDEPLDREALARRLASVRRAVDDVEQLVQRQASENS